MSTAGDVVRPVLVCNGLIGPIGLLDAVRISGTHPTLGPRDVCGQGLPGVHAWVCVCVCGDVCVLCFSSHGISMWGVFCGMVFVFPSAPSQRWKCENSINWKYEKCERIDNP